LRSVCCPRLKVRPVPHVAGEGRCSRCVPACCAYSRSSAARQWSRSCCRSFWPRRKAAMTARSSATRASVVASRSIGAVRGLTPGSASAGRTGTNLGAIGRLPRVECCHDVSCSVERCAASSRTNGVSHEPRYRRGAPLAACESYVHKCTPSKAEKACRQSKLKQVDAASAMAWQSMVNSILTTSSETLRRRNPMDLDLPNLREVAATLTGWRRRLRSPFEICDTIGD
jgi:hypothetical protein